MKTVHLCVLGMACLPLGLSCKPRDESVVSESGGLAPARAVEAAKPFYAFTLPDID